METDKIYDVIEELLAIDLRHLDEDERYETEYLLLFDFQYGRTVPYHMFFPPDRSLTCHRWHIP